MFWHVLFTEDFEEDILEMWSQAEGSPRPAGICILRQLSLPCRTAGHHGPAWRPTEGKPFAPEPTEQESLLGPTSQWIKTVMEIRSNFLQTMKNYSGWVYVLLYPLFFTEDTKCNKEAPTHHTGFTHMENNFSWQGLRNVSKLRCCNGKNGPFSQTGSCKHSWLLRL